MDKATEGFFGRATKVKDSQYLRARIAELLGQSQERLPAAQPISLEPKRDLSAMLTRDFKVCEKTDGTRFLLFIELSGLRMRDGDLERATRHPSTTVLVPAYFIDREYQFYQVSAKLLFGGLRDALGARTRDDLVRTRLLLDGEVVCDGAGTPTEQLVFYLFDTLYAGSGPALLQPLSIRLAYADRAASYIQAVYNGAEQSLIPRGKLFVDKTEIGRILEQQKALLHHSDGLIFTQEEAPYIFGTTNTILKWKPLHENTVDLMVKTHCQNGSLLDDTTGNVVQGQQFFTFRFYTATGGLISTEPIELGGVTLVDYEKYRAMCERINRLQGQNLILECYWDKAKETRTLQHTGDRDGVSIYRIITQKGAWASKKIRVDKSMPNDRKVYESVLRAYDQFLSIERLIEIIAGQASAPGVCRRENPFVRHRYGYICQALENYD